jgi:hypothetical protein
LRHDAVLDAVRVAPDDRLAVGGTVQRPAEAVEVDPVHVAADAAADQRPDDGAADDRRRAVATATELGADQSAGGAADEDADEIAIAAVDIDAAGRCIGPVAARLVIVVIVVIIVLIVIAIMDMVVPCPCFAQ